MRDNKGTFKRIREPWTPDKWDDGYVDNRGRFRVYRPDYPRHYAEGYALRYHVVWWLKTGSVHPSGTALHHKDGVKTNDRFENLELMDHAKHSLEHNPPRPIYRACARCGTLFEIQHRDMKRRATMKYCSYQCYNLTPRSPEHKRKLAAILNRYRGVRHSIPTF